MKPFDRKIEPQLGKRDIIGKKGCFDEKVKIDPFKHMVDGVRLISDQLLDACLEIPASHNLDRRKAALIAIVHGAF